MSRSRRSFLRTGALLTAASFAERRSSASGTADLHGAPLQQFGYADVELLPGPLREQFDRNHTFYSRLDEDELLKPYRQRAGLAAPGDDMGGWYSWAPLDALSKPGNNGFAPGHSFGQYLSGLSRDYAATGDKQTQEKVHRLVRNFAPALSEKFWVGNRFPAYTYDKICIGLIDAHQFAGAPDALAMLDKALDSVSAHLPPGGISRADQLAHPHSDDSFCWDEPYTIPENAFLAYERSGKPRYRELATHFLANSWYYDPLSRGENVLPGKHAYSHVNCLSSAMQAYFMLRDEKYLRAAKNGFDFVRAQSFATGGWGPNEEFRKPGSGELGESLTKTHSSFETPCGSYAHFKITRYLLRATQESSYGDAMERVLYNCILGAKPIEEDGHGFYYSDYNNVGSKIYHPYKWHCCTGTFSQITADYGISSYFADGQGVYVNLYVPSKLTWARGGNRVVLVQSTKYPLERAVSLEIQTQAPADFAIRLRVPAWAGPRTTIAVNGKRFIAGPKPGSFASVKRTWKNGDRVEIEFDMGTVLEPVDDQHPDLVAAVHGPLALFSVGELPASVTKRELRGASQIAAGSTDWQARSGAGTVSLRPFTAISDERYRLYLKVDAEG
jgi:uncharacterized protein